MNRTTAIAFAFTIAGTIGMAPAATDDGEPVEVYVESYDGAYIGAGLRKPPGDGPFPAVLFIHGGLGGSRSAGMARFTTQPVPEHFFKQGYVVMSTDYRRYHFGEDEIQDVTAAYRVLESYPFVDADRIAVIGGSHGGYLTMMLCTRVKPAAAVSFAGLSDIEGMFYDNAQRMRAVLTGYEDWQQRLFANKNARARQARRADEGRENQRARRDASKAKSDEPLEVDAATPNGSAAFEVTLDLAWRFGDEREAYRRISPLNNTDMMNSPLLYVVGSEDRLRTAGKQVIEALKARSVSAAYSLHEGMGHGFYWGTRGAPDQQPQQFHDALKVTSDWVNAHLNRQAKPNE